jgi:hypothetical protein
MKFISKNSFILELEIVLGFKKEGGHLGSTKRKIRQPSHPHFLGLAQFAH